MMVEEERGLGASSRTTARRDPNEILRESRGLLKEFLSLVDELDEAIKETRAEAARGRDSSHRWGL